MKDASFSPAYIDSTANMETTARRLLAGRLLNAGQICLAPDYVLCTSDLQDSFVKAASKVITEWYGNDPKSSPDMSRIINDRHFQ